MRLTILTVLLSSACAFGQPGPIPGRYVGTHIGNGAGLTNLIGNPRVLFISPTGVSNNAVRGSIDRPSSNFWSFSGGVASGVCAQATNGDTIVVMPGFHLAAVLPLNEGVKLIGLGQPFIKRTNFFIGGTNAAFNASRPMVYVNDNTLIEGITFQCGTNTYDAIVGPNVPNEVDGPYSIQTLDASPYSIYGANVNDLHQLFIWPEYGLTNFQVAATNCIFRNCTMKGATDILYGGGDATVSLVVSNANIPGFEEIVVSNVLSSDISFENCIFRCQWDIVRVKGIMANYRTIGCQWFVSSDMTVSVGGVGADGSARAVFMLTGDTLGSWTDIGSRIVVATGTRINEGLQSQGAHVNMSGTMWYVSNGPPVVIPAAFPPPVYGTWLDMINGPTLIQMGVTNVLYGTIIGNGLGLTNVAGPSIQTNWISGRLYTNTSAGNWHVRAMATWTTAAVTGGAEIDLQVGAQGAALSRLSGAGAATTIAVTLAQSYTNEIGGYINAGQVFAFTNVSGGAGNVSSLVPGTGQKKQW